jgi:hypothetical protein
MINRIARVLHRPSSAINRPLGCFDSSRLLVLAHARSLWYFGEHKPTRPFRDVAGNCA